MKERTYIFEFKLTSQTNKNAAGLMEEAAAQIIDTDYAKGFSGSRKPVSLLPVVFDYKKERAVLEWKEMSRQD